MQKEQRTWVGKTHAERALGILGGFKPWHQLTPCHLEKLPLKNPNRPLYVTKDKTISEALRLPHILSWSLKRAEAESFELDIQRNFKEG